MDKLSILPPVVMSELPSKQPTQAAGQARVHRDLPAADTWRATDVSREIYLQTVSYPLAEAIDADMFKKLTREP